MTLATDTLVRGIDGNPPSAHPADRSLRVGSRTVPLREVLAVVMPPVGTMLIVLAHHRAAGLDQPDGLVFALHWTGFLGGMLSLVCLACASRTSAVTRTCALAGIGLFGMVSRLLHFFPGGSDEFIHLRQAMETYINGDVGHTLNLLPITKDFFGLHQVTSAFAHLSGIPLWTAATTVIVLAHILSILAVYQLARNVDIPAPGAAVGAVVYSLNPSWMYFNIAFSYEGLALPLVLWCLAATVAAGRATERPAIRPIAAAALCVAVLPTIHHLSTITLFLTLVLLIAARLVPWFPLAVTGHLDLRRERIWPLVLIWCFLNASMAFWWAGEYKRLITYLGPALSEGYAQLQKILSGASRSSGGGRKLFANSENPIYEIACGYLFPVITLGLFLWALCVMWRNRRHIGSALWAFVVIGAGFFGSMPMLLTSGGAEGAHRSWGYSFTGIAVMCGLAWSFGPRSRGAIARRWPRMASSLFRPRIRVGAAIVVFIIMTLGGASLGATVSHRFPGPPRVGDDARAVTYQSRAVADWLAVNAPVDTPVMADRYVSTLVGSLGRMAPLRPSQSFPVWELYISTEPVRPEVLKQIWDAKIRYFVVDSRMATTLPKSGTWFVRDEPMRGKRTLIPQSGLDRFNCLPWLKGVFAAGSLTVYEVDRDALRRTAAGSCEVPQGE